MSKLTHIIKYLANFSCFIIKKLLMLNFLRVKSNVIKQRLVKMSYKGKFFFSIVRDFGSRQFIYNYFVQ